jgi:hypothetical protein
MYRGVGALARPDLAATVEHTAAKRLDDAYRLALNGEESALDALAKAARAVEARLHPRMPRKRVLRHYRA